MDKRVRAFGQDRTARLPAPMNPGDLVVLQGLPAAQSILKLLEAFDRRSVSGLNNGPVARRQDRRA